MISTWLVEQAKKADDVPNLLLPRSTMTLDSNVLLETLQKITPLCSAETSGNLAQHFTLQTFKRAAPILQQGDIWADVLLVESGIIRMHFLRADGREFNKNFFAENSMLCPLTPAMWSAPSLFGISAIEHTQIWHCPIKLFMDKLQTPAWQALQGGLLMRLLDSKLQREHDLLALTGRQRYEKLCQTQSAIAERVPLLHLATYLGMTDVSLSRLRHAKD